MRPEKLYLRDIISACKQANLYVCDIERTDFEKSSLHQSAVLFNLMIIGEAASKITPELKGRHPEVDWQSLKGFRNIITHAYFSLNLDIVWDSANRESLELIDQIEAIVRLEYPDLPLTTEN
ncbi:MAG: DUF86 domain-containing protein [Pyrinomonadaceae bacterium]|nr:DUF86 domain-containing protein [Pyrinomonadaceae bacterium]